MIVDLTEEEAEFLARVVDRAMKLAWLVESKPELIAGYREPWNWVSDGDKCEILLKKLVPIMSTSKDENG